MPAFAGMTNKEGPENNQLFRRMGAKKDVIIIGGGAIGLCAAYYLTCSGASVTVVDKGQMGHGCSLHNAGFVTPSHFVPLAAPGVFAQALRWMFDRKSPFHIKPRIDLDLLSWAWRFRKACDDRVAQRAMPVLRDLLVESSHLFEELAKVDGMSFEWTKKGLLLLYRTEKGKRSCEHDLKLSHELGIDARGVRDHQLRELDPHTEFRALGGVYFAGDGHLVPSSLVKNLTDHLQHNHVQLLANCSVTGFETSAGRITAVQTDRGLLRGDEFVLATGVWSSLLLRDLRISLPLEAGKGYSITVKHPSVKPEIPYILSERRVAITPFTDSLRFAGTMDLAGIDLTLNPLRIDAILDAVSLYFANIERPDPSNAELWSGLRPVTPDGLPYIGRLKQFPNLIAATGHAMLGISLATVTGKLVAEIVKGRTPSHNIAFLHPNRYD
jgi:D-amino-acid dehydrogenase